MTSDDLRSQYEQAVLGLRCRVAEMRSMGMTVEAIAHVVHAERRSLAAHFKERTPEPLRSRLYAHTLTVYGDLLGPSIEHLRHHGKSWNDITESATRPGPLPALGDPAAKSDQSH